MRGRGAGIYLSFDFRWEPGKSMMTFSNLLFSGLLSFAWHGGLDFLKVIVMGVMTDKRRGEDLIV